MPERTNHFGLLTAVLEYRRSTDTGNDCTARLSPHAGTEVPQKWWKRARRAQRRAWRVCACGSATRSSNHEYPVSIQNVAEAPCLLTLKQVAQRLAVCRRTLEREIAAGRFPRPRRIGRSVRVFESDFRAYLETLKASVPASP